MADIFETTQKICTVLDKAQDMLVQIRDAADRINTRTDLNEVQKKRDLLQTEVDEENTLEKARADIDAIAESAIQDEARRMISAETTPRLQTAQHLALIANALKYVELLGDDLTTDQVQAIIEPLKAAEDWRSIGLIRAIIRKTDPYKERVTSVEVWGEDPQENIDFIQRMANNAKTALTEPAAETLMSLDIQRRFKPTVKTYTPEELLDNNPQA